MFYLCMLISTDVNVQHHYLWNYHNEKINKKNISKTKLNNGQQNIRPMYDYNFPLMQPHTKHIYK